MLCCDVTGSSSRCLRCASQPAIVAWLSCARIINIQHMFTLPLLASWKCTHYQLASWQLACYCEHTPCSVLIYFSDTCLIRHAGGPPLQCTYSPAKGPTGARHAQGDASGGGRGAEPAACTGWSGASAGPSGGYEGVASKFLMNVLRFDVLGV